jgi:hypothetical protein
MLDPSGVVPAPSPEAVQSIVEVMELLEHGERAQAVGLLEGCFRIVSPRMLAFDQLLFINNAIGEGKQEISYQNPMEFDMFHYADAAIRLNLAAEIEDEEMREVIEAVRASQPAVELSIELRARFERFADGQKRSESAGL